MAQNMVSILFGLLIWNAAVICYGQSSTGVSTIESLDHILRSLSSLEEYVRHFRDTFDDAEHSHTAEACASTTKKPGRRSFGSIAGLFLGNNHDHAGQVDLVKSDLQNYKDSLMREQRLADQITSNRENAIMGNLRQEMSQREKISDSNRDNLIYKNRAEMEYNTLRRDQDQMIPVMMH